MANTEGMSDEAVASLFSSPADVPTIKKKGAKSKRSVLQSRLDMPMGERPAARVIKSTSKSRPASLHPSIEEEEDEEEEENASPQMPPEPVLGDIVERSISGRKKTNRSARQSRFAQERVAGAKSGFPSVNVPLGTFVKNKPRQNENQQPKQTTQTPSSATGRPLPRAAQDFKSLRDASANDAEAMISSMSKNEIQESIQEVENSLSPEMIAFLRKRKSKAVVNKTNEKPEGSVEFEDNAKESTDTEKRDDSALKIISSSESTLKSDDEETREKERMAEIMASIKTYEDLDEAYEAEMERQGLLDSKSSQSVTIYEGKDSFEVACNLLRSTSSRQTLWAARTVCLKLSGDYLDGKTYPLESRITDLDDRKWPYPLLLPVSLRCLLDEPMSRVNNCVLHAYVLKAIYTLLLLRAPTEHIVDLFSASNGTFAASPSDIYQHHFMDDAIPSPPVAELYSALTGAKPLVSSEENGVAAYATSSSSTSANDDGEKFAQDPMWTLVSKMKILPRLAQILYWVNNENTHLSFFPKEIIISVCGILTMLAQRTRGAASAIVLHESILPDLVNVAFDRNNKTGNTNNALVLAVIIFLCTVARQSRVAAEGLKRVEIDSILLQILAGKVKDEQDFRLQKWALVLWRTLLRYGLSLSIISAMSTLAAPYITLGKNPEVSGFSLCTEFYSCFTVMLYCARGMEQALEEAGDEKDSVTNLISTQQSDALSDACRSMSSSKRQAINHLIHFDLDRLQDAEYLKFLASLFRFLDAMLKRSDSLSGIKGEFKSEEINGSEEDSCIEALLNLNASTEMRTIIDAALYGSQSVEIAELSINSPHEIRFETSSCAFLEAYLSFLGSLLKKLNSAVDEHDTTSGSKLISACEIVGDLLLSKLSGASCSNSGFPERPRIQFHTPRRHVLNRALSATVIFLHESNRFAERGHDTIRNTWFTLIGRLERGDERTAAILFSYDDLFEQSEKERLTSPSILSSILVRELCRTNEAQEQLDHSFRLHNGPGITASGLGPFRLQSLLSEADFGIPGNANFEHFLPIGKVWPWMLLSGSLDVSDTSSKKALYSEANQTILAALELITKIESFETSYVKNIDVGAKLYHVVSIGLQPEPILANDQIQSKAENILDLYLSQINAEDIVSFAEQCRRSIPKNARAPPEEDTPVTVSKADEEKLRAVLDGDTLNDASYSKETVRAIQALFSDLCDAFLDYGAQYSFFTKVIRLFAARGFPIKVRCEIFRRLKEALHLLSLQNDDLKALLKLCLSGGIPEVDNSSRDSPEFLDMISSLVTKDKTVREDAQFVVAFSIATLGRSIAINIRKDGKISSTSRRRLESLHSEVASKIIETSKLFLSRTGVVDDLIDATCHVVGSQGLTLRWFTDDVNETSLNNASKVLNQVSLNARLNAANP